MDNQSLFVKMAQLNWERPLKRCTELLNTLSDEQLSQEIAPGRNTGAYLAGHLIAVHDGLLPLFGLGEKLHPELAEIYITSPDRSGKATPSIPQLRAYWKEVHEHLEQKLASLTDEQWFQRHMDVSEEDFQKEPHRNRLNVLISRSLHIEYHRGQLILLKS
jgi:hypothetical protein